MTRKKPSNERRLLVVSKRRAPTDEGLARLVAAFVLYQLEEEQEQPDADLDAEDSA